MAGFYGSKDLKQIFTNYITYVILAFGFLLLLFLFFLAGTDGISAGFDWASQFEDGLWLIIAPFGGYFLGLVLLVLGFHEYGEYNLIRNTPTSTIRSAPMGRVEVKGTTKPTSEENKLISPFVGEECVGYECEVEEYNYDDDGSNWQTVYQTRETIPFLLEDDTGRIMIDGEQAEWSIGSSDYREEFDENEAPDRIKNFLQKEIEQNQALDFDLLGGDHFRFTENRIDVNEDLYVLGGAEPIDHRDDLDSDQTDTVIGKDERTDMFYISDESEEAIITSKWWGIVTAIGIGTILTPASALALCQIFGVI